MSLYFLLLPPPWAFAFICNIFLIFGDIKHMSNSCISKLNTALLINAMYSTLLALKILCVEHVTCMPIPNLDFSLVVALSHHIATKTLESVRYWASSDRFKCHIYSEEARWTSKVLLINAYMSLAANCRFISSIHTVEKLSYIYCMSTEQCNY